MSNIDISRAPKDATHYSDGIDGIYWPAFWKEGPKGCWAFVLVEGEMAEWNFHECVEMPQRSRSIKLHPDYDNYAAKFAAEARDKAIAEMAGLFHIPEDGTERQVYGFCSTLFDAGYKKVQP